jgi:hypothetical protein
MGCCFTRVDAAEPSKAPRYVEQEVVPVSSLVKNQPRLNCLQSAEVRRARSAGSTFKHITILELAPYVVASYVLIMVAQKLLKPALKLPQSADCQTEARARRAPPLALQVN